MNSKRILDKLRGEAKSNKKAHTYYLDKDITEEFKKKCEDVSPSLVMEDLMKRFIEGTIMDHAGEPEPTNPNLSEAINLLKSLDPEALDSATGLLRKAAKHSAYLKKTK